MALIERLPRGRLLEGRGEGMKWFWEVLECTIVSMIKGDPIKDGPDLRAIITGPGKLLYMAVRDIGDLRAQNQPQVCLNFGDFRVQGRKNRPKVVRFGGFETYLGCFGPGPWTKIV